jgi:hypothetical protein
MSVRDQLKVYHWQTHSYSRHKASDKFVDILSAKMDNFIEVMQGGRSTRLVMSTKDAVILDNHTDTSADTLLREFRIWLIKTLPSYLKEDESDLLNLRDEILAEVNKSLYLFTLK